MQPEEQARGIKNREDFVVFVKTLQSELLQKPEAWTNVDLASYLEALAAWTEDMDGFYLNNNRPVPEGVPWNVFADILIGAKVYE